MTIQPPTSSAHIEAQSNGGALFSVAPQHEVGEVVKASGTADTGKAIYEAAVRAQAAFRNDGVI